MAVVVIDPRTSRCVSTGYLRHMHPEVEPERPIETLAQAGDLRPCGWFLWRHPEVDHVNETIAGETVEAVPTLLQPGLLQKRSLVVNDCAHSLRFTSQIRHRPNLSPVHAQTCPRKPVERVLMGIGYRALRQVQDL